MLVQTVLADHMDLDTAFFSMDASYDDASTIDLRTTEGSNSFLSGADYTLIDMDATLESLGDHDFEQYTAIKDHTISRVSSSSSVTSLASGVPNAERISIDILNSSIEQDIKAFTEEPKVPGSVSSIPASPIFELQKHMNYLETTLEIYRQTIQDLELKTQMK